MNTITKIRALISQRELPTAFNQFGCEKGLYSEEEAIGTYKNGKALKYIYNTLTPQILADSFHYVLELKATETPDAELPLGASKVYGKPHLPKGYELDTPFPFYAQINCKDLAPFDLPYKLPVEGMLYFFLDRAKPCYELGDILYLNVSESELALSEHGETIEGAIARSLSVHPAISLYIDGERDGFDLLPDELKAEIEALAGIPLKKELCPKFQMLGVAEWWQGEDECRRDEDEEAFLGAKNRLLFQATEGDWAYHFWVPNDHLSALNFSQVEVTSTGS